MLAFSLVASFFACTLIGGELELDANEEDVIMFVEEPLATPHMRFMEAQKQIAFDTIMAALLETEWRPFYEPILCNIAQFIEGFEYQDKEGLGGNLGLTSGARFLDKLRDIHRGHYPSSKNKVALLAGLKAETEKALFAAKVLKLAFSAKEQQEQQFQDETNELLLKMRENPSKRILGLKISDNRINNPKRLAKEAGITHQETDKAFLFLKEEWGAGINQVTRMRPLREALTTILYKIASERTTYFHENTYEIKE